MLWTVVLWCWHHLTYSVQRVSTFSFSHRLLVLGCTSLVHVGLGASLYRLVSGDSWSCALFKSYGVLFRAPGFAVSNETTLAASVVMNTLFIFGLFVFAVLIGMISDEIKQQIHAMRMGDVELRLRGHTLVLNWNCLTLSLLRQLCHAQNDPKHRLYKRPVVVLADRLKSDMDQTVYNAMRGYKFEVFVHSGRPSKQQDLSRVAAHTAGTVLLLQPEPCSSEAAAEALKATSLVSLRCLQLTASTDHCGTYYQPGSSRRAFTTVAAEICRCLDSIALHVLGRHVFAHLYNRFSSNLQTGSTGRQLDSMRVVVQVPNMQPSGDDLLGFLHSTTASVSNVQGARLLSQRMLDRLVAQTAVQPGTAHAFREIMRAGGDSAQLCFCDVDQQLTGSYKEAQQQFADAVLLGVLTAADRQLRLNPSPVFKLLEGDRLLGFTRRGALTPRAASASGGSSSGWHCLGRPLSRASSMSSRSLHEVSSAGSITPDNSISHTAGPGMDKALTVIVLGWASAAVPALLSSLQDTAPEGSCFVILHQKAHVQHDGEQAAVAAAAVAAATAAAVAGAAGHNSSGADGTSNKAGEPGSDGQEQQHQQPGYACCSPSPQPADCSKQQEQPQRFTCRHMYVSEPCSVKALLSAGITAADAVIIGGQLAPQSTGEADAMVVAALLALQQALQPTHTAAAVSAVPQPQSAVESLVNNTLHVVAVLSSYSVRRAVQVFLDSMLVRNFSYEIMVLDEYAAAMLVQVAQDPATSLVMDQLLIQTSGPGLLMLPADALGLRIGRTVSFRQVNNAARRRRSTALGYRRADGRMLLAPFDADEVCFSAGDRIVVVGSDM